MSNTSTLKQLQRALQIAEQIAALEEELKSVLAGAPSAEREAASKKTTTAAATTTSATATPKATRGRGKKQRAKRVVSPEARARMAAAQRNRRNREKRSK